MPEGKMRDAAMAGAVAIEAVSRSPETAERTIANQLGLEWDERALVRFAAKFQTNAATPLVDVAVRGFFRAQPDVCSAAAQVMRLRRPVRVLAVLARMQQTPNRFLQSPEPPAAVDPAGEGETVHKDLTARSTREHGGQAATGGRPLGT